MRKRDSYHYSIISIKKVYFRRTFILWLICFIIQTILYTFPRLFSHHITYLFQTKWQIENKSQNHFHISYLSSVISNPIHFFQHTPNFIHLLSYSDVTSDKWIATCAEKLILTHIRHLHEKNLSCMPSFVAFAYEMGESYSIRRKWTLKWSKSNIWQDETAIHIPFHIEF